MTTLIAFIKSATSFQIDIHNTQETAAAPESVYKTIGINHRGRILESRRVRRLYIFQDARAAMCARE